MEQATARLRKTFQYPNDADDDDDGVNPTSEALDEEEQTNLIQTLNTQNTATNTLYTRILLLLTLLCTPLYLPSLFSTTALPALLALTSLSCSLYILLYLPPGTTGITFLDDLFSSSSSSSPASASASRSDNHLSKNKINKNSANIPHLGQRIDKSPLEIYIPYLNLILIALIAILGFLINSSTSGSTSTSTGQGRGSILSGLTSPSAWSRLSLLPGVLYMVVLAGKLVMASVDPAVVQLEGLRYGYKGA